MSTSVVQLATLSSSRRYCEREQQYSLLQELSGLGLIILSGGTTTADKTVNEPPAHFTI